jgi:S1-C subfamily serine protease
VRFDVEARMQREISGVDGAAVQLRNGLALLRVGQNVELRLLRNGAERSVNLTITPATSGNRP